MQEKRGEEEVIVEIAECVISNDISDAVSVISELLMLTVGSEQRRMLSSVKLESWVTRIK